MQSKDVKIWYASVASFAVAACPFFVFMFKTKLEMLAVSLAFIAASALFYVFATKKITHPQDKYTAIHAMRFAAKCRNAGFRNSTICKENKNGFLEIVSADENMKGLDFKQALEAYRIGSQLISEMKSKDKKELT